MSKSNIKSKPVGMLIETSAQTKHLMLKRRRLFVMGPNIPVRPLACPDKSQSWVNASIERTDDGNPWDIAHDLAARVKKELGQPVFVEPDTGDSSRFGTLHIPKRKKNASTKAAMKALVGQKGKGASSSAANVLGFGGMRSGAANNGMFGANSMGSMSGLPDMGSMMPAIPDPLADVLPAGVMEALSMQEEMKAPQEDDEENDGSKKVAEALASLPNWLDLELTRKQMFEAEARQLFAYIESQPVTEADRSVDLVARLIASQSISASLKSFLVKATEGKASEQPA